MAKPLSELLQPNGRSDKPRDRGLTMMLDKGLGVRAIADLGETAGAHCDLAKIAWGSSLITGNLEAKLKAYRSAGIEPMFGGTLFEYCHMHGKAEELLDFCREHRIHIEISDGVIELPRDEKLRWIESFAAAGSVYSEVGGKISPKGLDWEKAIREELDAGASKVVVEGREIGPVGKEIRTDLIDLLTERFPVETLFFEALERYQQVWLIKRLGPDVNLGNILPKDILTLESFRRGLKEHTLLHFAKR